MENKTLKDRCKGLKPWLYSFLFFGVIIAIGTVLTLVMMALKLLGAGIPVIIGISLAILLIRYTVFK